MAKHKIRNVNKKLTEGDRQRHAEIRRQIEGEKEEIIALGVRSMARQARLRNAVGVLKSTRETLGLTLEDIKARTGIEKGNLSRLENAAHPNPTVDTLIRYADAVGKELVIELVDKGVHQ
jgi:hypothetical protein